MQYTYDPEKISYFATTDSRGVRVPFGIKAKDRMRHMYVIGKTGMGKSTLLENLAIQDIQSGEGLCFIDPHGSTASKLLDYVPEERIKDVIYFAPFDMDYPLGFNVMEDVGYDKRHLVVAGLMSAFKRIWVDAWSSRMEYILQNTLLALLEYPDTTLIDINRMLSNKTFRKKVVSAISDPIVKRFWEEEFAGYTDRYVQEATPAIQNKIGQFTSNPLVRNIIGQVKSTFDIRRAMDERKILIVNLSKGRMGEQNADLLGSILTTKIYLSAMSRAEMSQAELDALPPFYFYVDEFQSIANDSFANILSEARKYKLSLTIAHQYIEQVEENIRAAVFGNVGTTISFRVGPFDAEVLKTIFEPTFTAEDLVNLGFAQIYLTLMIDGVGSKPFSARTLPPLDMPPFSFKHEIIKHSQETYGRKRADVERMLSEVATRAGDEAIKNATQQRAQAQNKTIAQNKQKNSQNKNATPTPQRNVLQSAKIQSNSSAQSVPGANAQSGSVVTDKSVKDKTNTGDSFAQKTKQTNNQKTQNGKLIKPLVEAKSGKTPKTNNSKRTIKQDKSKQELKAALESLFAKTESNKDTKEQTSPNANSDVKDVLQSKANAQTQEKKPNLPKTEDNKRSDNDKFQDNAKKQKTPEQPVSSKTDELSEELLRQILRDDI